MKWKDLRELSWPKRIQWVLQYYGVTIAVVVAALLVGIVFLTSVFGPGDEYAVKVMMLDARQSAENCHGFAQELSAMLGGECEVTAYAQGATYEEQAFAVRITGDELDVIIAPRAQMRQMLDNGYLLEMELLSPASRYQQITRGGEADDAQHYIGRVANSRHADAAMTAMQYFMEELE